MGRYGTVAHRGDIGRIHPLVGISESWLTVFDGIPIVRPELCVYQLCGSVSPLRAERALDTAWAKGLVSGQSLRSCLDELAEHGRNGTVVLRTLLEARPNYYVPPASGIEARFQQLMSEALLGRWRRQVDSGGETWAGRVDFRHEVLPVVTEILSERYHSALSSQRDDDVRRAKLEAAGFLVVEVWDVEVWHRADQAVSRVRAALRAAQQAA